MVLAVLKLYFIGTALTVLAVLFEIVDSFGALMHARDHRSLELEHPHGQQFANNRDRGLSWTKNITLSLWLIRKL